MNNFENGALSLGEQFLAEIFSENPGLETYQKQINFHAEMPYLKETVREQKRENLQKTAEKQGVQNLQIVYYNCGRCNDMAKHSCVKKHRHQIETFTKNEFEMLYNAYVQKQKLQN